MGIEEKLRELREFSLLSLEDKRKQMRSDYGKRASKGHRDPRENLKWHIEIAADNLSRRDLTRIEAGPPKLSIGELGSLLEFFTASLCIEYVNESLEPITRSIPENVHDVWKAYVSLVRTIQTSPDTTACAIRAHWLLYRCAYVLGVMLDIYMIKHRGSALKDAEVLKAFPHAMFQEGQTLEASTASLVLNVEHEIGKLAGTS